MKLSWRSFALALALVLLSACATQPPTQYSETSILRSAKELTQWQIQGKVGITTTDDRLNANLEWQQQNQAYTIGLSGPFGQGRANLEGNDHSITLTTGNELFKGRSAEDLMQQQLGWSVPVQHFVYWARGLPSPLAKITAIEYDDTGALSTLAQDGWLIDISRYRAVQDWRLPGRLSAKTDNLSLVMVVKEWQVP